MTYPKIISSVLNKKTKQQLVQLLLVLRLTGGKGNPHFSLVQVAI